MRVVSLNFSHQNLRSQFNQVSNVFVNDFVAEEERNTSRNYLRRQLFLSPLIWREISAFKGKTSDIVRIKILNLG